MKAIRVDVAIPVLGFLGYADMPNIVSQIAPASRARNCYIAAVAAEILGTLPWTD